ncbi:MAG TPA: FmdB family zinc ribbon protein [Fimbriimonas sp.]|nr:FmdB family zinc ribbon protein [Fimbriimonas sp.]
MPIYVYACKACDSTFETEQRIVESPLEDCLLCRAHGTVKRVIQPVGIAFKGSGFHINDYSPAAGTKESTETQKEAKPASEPAAAPAPSTTPETPSPSTEPTSST